MIARQNYVCPGRLERARQQVNELFTGPEQNELTRLAEWASTTRDGSLSDLSVEPDPKVWTQVCSEAHLCTQKTCGQNPRCFYQQARKRLLAADLIVLNHTLLFILLGSPDAQQERESGFLFPNDFIIFDEAHTVEQVASKQIGIGVTQYGLRSTIQRLYNGRTRKGLFTVMRDAAGVRLAAELVDDVDKFFSAVDLKSDFRKGREFVVRICATEAEPVQLGSLYDFQKEMNMFVVQKMADPRGDGYHKALEHWIAHFVQKTDGHAFVLFTSYRDMQQVAGAMEKFF